MYLNISIMHTFYQYFSDNIVFILKNLQITDNLWLVRIIKVKQFTFIVNIKGEDSICPIK